MQKINNSLVLIATAILFHLVSLPAQAGDFFEELFGGDDGSSNRVQSNSSFNRRSPNASQSSENTNSSGNINSSIEAGSASGGRNFCVRICDGYHFPLIRNEKSTKQESCELACPSASMDIYTGASIENSKNLKGESYAVLKAAVSTPQMKSEKCACNAPESSHSYYLKRLRSDPTLADGDIIIELGQAFVYSKSAFIPIEKSRKLATAKVSQITSIVAASRMHPFANIDTPQVTTNDLTVQKSAAAPSSELNKGTKSAELIKSADTKGNGQHTLKETYK